MSSDDLDPEAVVTLLLTLIGSCVGTWGEFTLLDLPVRFDDLSSSKVFIT